MKLIKIYSNHTNLFKSIIFNEHINFILSSGHSLGKTKLLELIDYCLLKDKPSFLKLKKFKDIGDLEFYLEIKVEDKYITIKRIVNGHSKNYLKLSNKSLDCTDITEYNYSGGQDKIKSELTKILNFILTDRVLDYRNYISYFLRTQDDQSDIFRLNKFIRTLDKNYKPIIATLLGLDGISIKDKYDIQSNIEELENDIEQLSLEDTQEYITEEIRLLKISKDEKEKQYNEFDFYFSEKNISKELVYKIESEISNYNKRRNYLLREIKYIDQTKEENLLVDIDDLQGLFDELKLCFPTEIKKEYQNVIDFNKSISEERVEILKDNRVKFINEIDCIENDLTLLNNKRKEMLSILEDSDTMSKFKKLEREIIDIEKNIINEEIKLKNYEIIDEKRKELKTKKEHLENIINKVKESIKIFNENSNIKNNIVRFAKILFNEKVLFVAQLNKENNLDFELKVADNNQFDNKKDQGHTYTKLLSFLFSISILVNYNDKRFFKFVVLDSPFDGDQIEFQNGLFNLMEAVTNEYNLQIIVTSIEDEIKNTEHLSNAQKHKVRYLKNTDKLLGNF